MRGECMIFRISTCQLRVRDSHSRFLQNIGMEASLWACLARWSAAEPSEPARRATPSGQEIDVFSEQVYRTGCLGGALA